jgi:glycosyltransferase involved in cell wall biosynthesis
VRILFLDQFSELGGGQHALLDTVAAVQKKGWEPYVLVPGQGALVGALQARNVRVEEISCGPYESGRKSVWDALRFAADLRGQARAIGDLVSAANIGLIYVNGPRLLPAAVLAAQSGTPLAFHVHHHLRGAALRLARWFLHRSKAAVLGCSNSVLEPLRGHIDESRMHVVPNGVRDAGYRDRDFDRRGGWRIGIIGRVSPEKGHLEFVQAAGMLKNEFPQARFVVCGAPLFEERGDYLREVRRRAQDLQVEFLGWQEDVGAVLHDLDLLAAPSKQEGMGRVVLEAFSAGVPVIAFPAGGIPEAVVDGETGFLTRELSAESLAARMRDAMGSAPDVLRRMAWNTRQTWERCYTIARYQQDVTGWLETLAPASKQECAAEMPLPRR